MHLPAYADGVAVGDVATRPHVALHPNGAYCCAAVDAHTDASPAAEPYAYAVPVMGNK